MGWSPISTSAINVAGPGTRLLMRRSGHRRPPRMPPNAASSPPTSQLCPFGYFVCFVVHSVCGIPPGRDSPATDRWRHDSYCLSWAPLSCGRGPLGWAHPLTPSGLASQLWVTRGAFFPSFPSPHVPRQPARPGSRYHRGLSRGGHGHRSARLRCSQVRGGLLPRGPQARQAVPVFPVVRQRHRAAGRREHRELRLPAGRAGRLAVVPDGFHEPVFLVHDGLVPPGAAHHGVRPV